MKRECRRRNTVLSRVVMVWCSVRKMRATLDGTKQGISEFLNETGTDLFSGLKILRRIHRKMCT